MRSCIAAGLVLVALACTHRTTSQAAATPQQGGSQVRLAVTNHYSLSADIFAVAAGTKLRLGTVNPGITRTFVLPPNITGLGLVSFVAEILNENPVISDGLQLVSGDVVEFEIAMHLVASRARVKGQ